MNTEKLYHYTYIITNIIENKYYIGCRSCNIHPSKDLGVKYFSSSKDKEFIQDQKLNPQNYKYKVIAIFDSRALAVHLEVKLHNIHNVAVNPCFYNRSKQTTVGWDTTGVVPWNKGIPRTEEVKQKLREANTGKKLSEAARKKMSEFQKGRPKSAEHRRKIGESQKGKVISDYVRACSSAAHKGKKVVHSEETRKKLSESKKGIKHPQAKLANIYKQSSNELIAENVVLSEWVVGTIYDRAALSRTAWADRTLPSTAKNQHFHKGIYALFVKSKTA